MGKGDSGWMQKGAVMPKDAPPNGGAALEVSDVGPGGRVSGMQTKLHCLAAADPGRRFDDLFNLVCDPATLMLAFVRVAGNRGCTDGRAGTRPWASCSHQSRDGPDQSLRRPGRTPCGWPGPVAADRPQGQPLAPGHQGHRRCSAVSVELHAARPVASSQMQATSVGLQLVFWDRDRPCIAQTIRQTNAPGIRLELRPGGVTPNLWPQFDLRVGSPPFYGTHAVVTVAHGREMSGSA
jgi:hypothetical protein